MDVAGGVAYGPTTSKLLRTRSTWSVVSPQHRFVRNVLAGIPTMPRTLPSTKQGIGAVASVTAPHRSHAGEPNTQAPAFTNLVSLLLPRTNREPRGCRSHRACGTTRIAPRSSYSYAQGNVHRLSPRAAQPRCRCTW